MAGKLRNLLRGLQYKPPTTDCPECAHAELRGVQYLYYYRRNVFPTTAESIAAMGKAYSRTMHALLGTGPVQTWYEIHKRRYIETGDMVEMKRMERHVSWRD